MYAFDTCTNTSYVKRYNDIPDAFEQFKKTRKFDAPDEEKVN